MTTITVTRVSRDELEAERDQVLSSTGLSAEELAEREREGRISVPQRNVLTRCRELTSLLRLTA
ncbi:UNVERIFIED_CONTAM: hypothetical protein RF649_02175 [Kocuria sp. CPCC 205295]|uniref:hypothetical protein n=1 Tax=unclassified Kocuria TaxID=2649579 RepID=UPI0034D69958